MAVVHVVNLVSQWLSTNQSHLEVRVKLVVLYFEVVYPSIYESNCLFLADGQLHSLGHASQFAILSILFSFTHKHTCAVRTKRQYKRWLESYFPLVDTVGEQCKCFSARTSISLSLSSSQYVCIINLYGHIILMRFFLGKCVTLNGNHILGCSVPTKTIV